MQFISAHKIHNGKQFLKAGSVLAINDHGLIEDIIDIESIDKTKVKFYEGILSPGFINAHCHLELSHFKDKIPTHTGLVNFVLNIMKTRNGFSLEEIKEAAKEADKQMQRNGIVAVGDICNTSQTLEPKLNSNIHYHSFVELIGLNPARAEQIFADGISIQNEYLKANLTATLAPHAPYTVSNEVMKMIANQKTTTSIHNQETIEEDLFFKHKNGDFLKLYSAINVPIDYFQASGTSSIRNYLKHLNNQQNLLLVHNVFSSKEDIDFAEKLSNSLFWCLCPNANLYIENTLPDIALLENSGCKICLGTDSLASNYTLSIADEMQVLLTHFPGTSLETLITWATYNGAHFLGLADTLGTIEKNKAPGINHLIQKPGSLTVEKVF